MIRIATVAVSHVLPNISYVYFNSNTGAVPGLPDVTVHGQTISKLNPVYLHMYICATIVEFDVYLTDFRLVVLADKTKVVHLERERLMEAQCGIIPPVIVFETFLGYRETRTRTVGVFAAFLGLLYMIFMQQHWKWICYEPIFMRLRRRKRSFERTLNSEQLAEQIPL